MTDVLALIPARGGSKAIPRKNIRPLCGRPLIGYTIDVARASSSVDRVVVSTDDAEIAAVACECGAEVPFRRPEEFARDRSPRGEVVDHALEWLSARGERPDVVVYLQPTSPLRAVDDVERSLAKVLSGDWSAAVSVCEPEHHPAWMMRIDQDGGIHSIQDLEVPNRRQELSTVYALNGAVYTSRSSYYEHSDGFFGESTAGVIMPRERSVDIDEPVDWRIAECLLSEDRRTGTLS